VLHCGALTHGMRSVTGYLRAMSILSQDPTSAAPVQKVHKETSGVALTWSLLAVFLAAVLAAVSIWGLPALGIAALSLVPVAYLILVILARP